MPGRRRFRRILNIPKEYLEVIPIGERLFPRLYQFENGLRLAMHEHMSVCYDRNWWEIKLKTDLPTIYDYAEEKRRGRELMPWIGASARTELLPIHYVTLGHLEEIVKKYKADCIPQLFPTLDFFLGRMYCIKLVRNLYSHMFPGLTNSDARTASRDIETLCLQLRAKLPIR